MDTQSQLDILVRNPLWWAEDVYGKASDWWQEGFQIRSSDKLGVAPTGMLEQSATKSAFVNTKSFCYTG